MKATAKLSYLRIAPRKARLVADLIRGKKVEDAQNILAFTIKRGVAPFLKLLNQAVANAKNNSQSEAKDLYISKILVDEGPRLKRFFPRSRGRANLILKRTSHIQIALNEIETGKGIKRAAKTEKTPLGTGKESAGEAEGGDKIKKSKVKTFRKSSESEKSANRRAKVGGGTKRIFRRKAI